MESDKIETTIFFGNGVNLLSKEGKSWDAILRQISKRQVLPPIGSNTLKYEYIVLPQERYTEIDYGFKITENDIPEPTEIIDTEQNIKEVLASELSGSKASFFYNKLVELKADNYITTNYELFLNNLLKERGFKQIGNGHFEYLLKPILTLEKGYDQVRLWNIHGNVYIPETMMFGLSDYCKYVIEIEKKIQDIENGSMNGNEIYWPYVMLHSDVHMFGFGLGYEEIDIWHFLTARKRLIRKNLITKNHIVYYTILDNSYDLGKMKMLEALDVDVVPINFDWSENAYEKAYNEIYKIIREQKVINNEND